MKHWSFFKGTSIGAVFIDISQPHASYGYEINPYKLEGDIGMFVCFSCGSFFFTNVQAGTQSQNLSQRWIGRFQVFQFWNTPKWQCRVSPKKKIGQKHLIPKLSKYLGERCDKAFGCLGNGCKMVSCIFVGYTSKVSHASPENYANSKFGARLPGAHFLGEPWLNFRGVKWWLVLIT